MTWIDRINGLTHICFLCSISLLFAAASAIFPTPMYVHLTSFYIYYRNLSLT